MEKFLYIFGYETPGLAAMNKRMTAKGIYSDCEDSEGFFIMAESKEEALAWGNKLADEYMKVLYNNPSMTLQSYDIAGSIDERELFSDWSEEYIRENPEEYEEAVEQVNKTLVVKVGEYPDIEKLVHERYGPVDLNP